VTQHSHYDAALFWDPYCSDSGENGVTTVVNANCGFGFAPVREGDVERTMAMMSTTEQIPVEHQRAALSWKWESFPEWLDELRGIPKGVNVLSYLPLNPLLIYVMGVDAAKTRVPTADEMAEIHRLINEAMDAGAIGLSMSVMGAAGNSHVDFDGTSMPTDAMHHDAIVDICRAVVERGEGVIQVLSQIAFYGDRTITERLAELAKGTAVRVIHNTFLTSDALPHMIPEDLAWLDEQRAVGRDVTATCRVNRAWVEAGIRELDTAAGQLAGVRRMVGCANDDELTALLDDPAFVAEFSAEYAGAGASNGAAGLENQIVIAVGDSEELQDLLGRTLGDIAEETDRTVVEDMHFQMSYKPARSVQIHDRGALLPGYWADVLIYDLDELFFDMTRYQIVYDMPGGDWRRKGDAGGYRYILVNGDITHESDQTTGRTPGQLVQVTMPGVP